MIAAIGLALSKFGSWVANNKAVQWVLGVLLFIVALILWGERREGQGRKQEKIKARERDVALKEEAAEYIEIVKEEGDEDAEQAIESRDAAGPLDPERMPDAQRDRIFGRNRTPEGSG